jgi:outer membrane protein assembly factor BamB
MSRASRAISMLVGAALVLSAAGIWAADWPQWRGPNRDAKVSDFMAPKSWPKALTQKWSETVGSGVSSPDLVGGKLYAFGRIDGDEVTTCLDANTGKTVWQDKHKTAAVGGPASGYGGPRSTPAVADGKVYTLGVNGTVSCLDAATGKVVWRKETEQSPQFKTSTSPLVADGKCIVFLDALTAFDAATGDVKWKGPTGAPYGSPALLTVAGTKQIVTPTSNQLVGVSLADGKVLWQVKLPGSGYNPNYGTPIIDSQTVIYCAPAKGGAGTSMALKIDKDGDGFKATEQWKSTAGYQYNTPVLKDGLLFGLSAEKTFFCMDAQTGKVLWTDETPRGEAGGVLSAGSVIVALTGPAAGGKGGGKGGFGGKEGGKGGDGGKGKGKGDFGKGDFGKGGGFGGKGGKGGGKGGFGGEQATGDAELIAFEPSGAGFKEVAKYKLSPGTGLAYPIISGNRVYVKGNKEVTLWTID